MPLPWKSSSSGSRQRSTNSQHLFAALDHPDLPSPPPKPLHRSTSVSDNRSSIGRVSDRPRDRSSVAILPSTSELGVVAEQQPIPSPQFGSGLSSPDFNAQQSPSYSPYAGSLGTPYQGGLRRDGPQLGSWETSPVFEQEGATWSPNLSQLQEHIEQPGNFVIEVPAAMSQQRAGSTASKASSDSGTGPMDAWSKRRMARLNTEQGFREQRQGGHNATSPPPASEQQQQQQQSGGYNTLGIQYAEAPAQPHFQQSQPHPSHQSYQGIRTSHSAQSGGGGLSLQTQSAANSKSPAYSQASDPPPSSTSQYSPPGAFAQYDNADNSRPGLQHSRSYTNSHQESSMSASKNGNISAPQPLRTGNNRQSMHNGMLSREMSGINSSHMSAQQQQHQQQQQQQHQQQQQQQQQQAQQQHQSVPAFSASIVPPQPQATNFKGDPPGQTEPRKSTPQPAQSGEDMTDEDVTQLIKDHKELREKYTKVKKYYFEKEDQVKQLQNSLAHQRLSASRTSLDDSEYTTRFNRLDGLIAQLAFSIRKSWRTVPSWLVGSVNKDAIQTGKQEMTAAGRAFIACWLVEEVFDKYFHPDLDPSFSLHLKSVQRNIRRFAPLAQTTEEDDFLTGKVVNWRLSTVEGLQEALRSPQCSQNRAQLTEMLKEQLVHALSVHLHDPAPSDLEGGVHMIIELVVSIAIHIPVESREIVIEYYFPAFPIAPDQMKVETGIPPLTISIADDAAERASVKSERSDLTDPNDPGSHDHIPKKRSMLSALTGSKAKSNNAKSAGAGGSSSSLNRPESQSGPKDDGPPKVRMAAGIAVSVRGRSVLVKAPVFST